MHWPLRVEGSASTKQLVLQSLLIFSFTLIFPSVSFSHTQFSFSPSSHFIFILLSFLISHWEKPRQRLGLLVRPLWSKFIRPKGISSLPLSSIMDKRWPGKAWPEGHPALYQTHTHTHTTKPVHITLTKRTHCNPAEIHHLSHSPWPHR